jgi:hypothetical protein
MAELARRFWIDGGFLDPADPVIVEQFVNNGIRGGEERLMLAVLQEAVECFQKYVLADYLWEKKLFREAEDWILEKNTEWLFSFENICEALQLNPDYIRRGLLVWKEAKRNKSLKQTWNHGKSVRNPPHDRVHELLARTNLPSKATSNLFEQGPSRRRSKKASGRNPKVFRNI